VQSRSADATISSRGEPRHTRCKNAIWQTTQALQARYCLDAPVIPDEKQWSQSKSGGRGKTAKPSNFQIDPDMNSVISDMEMHKSPQNMQGTVQKETL
jgi:hypothetical protein